MVETARRVSFLGIGVMGYPMAGHLARAGHQVRVYNRTPAKAEQWCAEYPGQIAATLAEAAQDAEIILLCVGRDEDVRAVINGKHGVAESLSAGAIVVDHSTTSAQLAREMAAWLKPQGAAFIDAPFLVARPALRTASSPSFAAGTQMPFNVQSQCCLAMRVRSLTSARGVAGSWLKWSTRFALPGCCKGWPKASTSACRPSCSKWAAGAGIPRVCCAGCNTEIDKLAVMKQD